MHTNLGKTENVQHMRNLEIAYMYVHNLGRLYSTVLVKRTDHSFSMCMNLVVASVLKFSSSVHEFSSSVHEFSTSVHEFRVVYMNLE